MNDKATLDHHQQVEMMSRLSPEGRSSLALRPWPFYDVSGGIATTSAGAAADRDVLRAKWYGPVRQRHHGLVP